MKKKLTFFFIFFCVHLFAKEVDTRSHQVIVSIAPYKSFVQEIAENSVKIDLLVPPGASFHDYEPTPQQVLASSKADIWFRVGELFETKAINALKSHNPKMKIVDLREGVDLILVDEDHPHACCHHHGADLHIWLSPIEAKKQAKLIAAALTEVYPENKELYHQNLSKFEKKLNQLDQEIKEILKPLKYRTFMVGHPAYAYFARDYNLEQFPIEFEGKDPTPRRLNEIFSKAKKDKVKTIFVQSQYSSKGASLIAKELNAKLMILDPYSGDYFSSMREIAKKIAEQEKKQ